MPTILVEPANAMAKADKIYFLVSKSKIAPIANDRNSPSEYPASKNIDDGNTQNRSSAFLAMTFPNRMRVTT